MTRLRASVAALFLLIGISAGGAVEPAPILADFFGSFSGRGLAADATLSADAPLRLRDLDVTIRRAGDGFVLSWTTVLSHPQDGRPHLHRRTSTHAFVPGPRPGWFRALESGDPVDGRPLIWARIDNDTMIVSVYSVMEDGHNDLQTYARRGVGGRMELSYTRVHENRTVTAVRGWLTRIGD